jgi:hypothetical protein
MTIVPALLPTPAYAADQSFTFDSSSPIRIVGGDWRWEYFDDGRLIGTGQGAITIAIGADTTARAAYARVERPSQRVELEGAVVVTTREGELRCDRLVYDEGTMTISADGNVTGIYKEPPLRIESSSARYLLPSDDGLREGEASFQGGVTLYTTDDGVLECDEVKYYEQRNIVIIPASFSGRLPLKFVKDADNPFYGKNAVYRGETLDALLTESGEFEHAVAENVTIDTGNAFISAPVLSVEQTDAGANAILYSPADVRVTGWYVTPEGRRGDFECDRIGAEQSSGRMRLSGRVKVFGDGFQVLSELVNLEYKDGAYTIASVRRTEIDIADLYFEEAS